MSVAFDEIQNTQVWPASHLWKKADPDWSWSRFQSCCLRFSQLWKGGGGMRYFFFHLQRKGLRRKKMAKKGGLERRVKLSFQIWSLNDSKIPDSMKFLHQNIKMWTIKREGKRQVEKIWLIHWPWQPQSISLGGWSGQKNGFESVRFWGFLWSALRSSPSSLLLPVVYLEADRHIDRQPELCDWTGWQPKALNSSILLLLCIYTVRTV